MEPGSRIWVSDAKEGWVLATIESRSGKQVTATTVRSGEQVTRKQDIDAFSMLGAEPGSLKSIDDLTRLAALHEPALLQTLQERFDSDQIYTWVGPILIAVNPFRKIPGLYVTKRWLNKESNLPPHIYGLADAAYRAMVDFHGQPQTILVSGESGAGKTETTKHAMQYLTECSHSGGHDVSAKILQANPLLECFGNAKTVRNDNSSRFGKLIEMRFADDGRHKLLSAGVTSYLLEKARIVHQARGERNYHVFYEIFQHPSASSKFKLSNPRSHVYVSSFSGEYERADISDSEQLAKTLEAMRVLGFASEDIERVLEIVAGVIHLGDVKFAPQKAGEASSVANPDKLKLCAEMLGLPCGTCSESSFTRPEKTLADVLCVRRMMVSAPGSNGEEEMFVKMLSPQQAEEARDALAMTIYERLFAWIVWRVNHSMGGAQHAASASSKSKHYSTEKAEERKFRVGILDIFGFEVFEENFFEQLCINYANEQLQRQFNEHVFELEQKMYESEGVDWTFVEYPDNSPTISMIEGKPIGLLALVDEECIYPNGSDRSLHSKLVQNLKSFERFSCPQSQARDFLFTVKHFAGDVTYTVEGFYRKNKNELRQDAVDLMCTSQKFLVKILLPPDAQEAAGGADASKYFGKRAEQLGVTVLASPGSKEAREWEKTALPVWESLDIPTNGTLNPRHNRVKSGRKASQIQQLTVSSHFKSQLHSALTLIRASKPSFVRCIKPNDRNKPSVFTRVRVLDQLRYSGVVEVIKVARAGYPTRFDLAHFLDRYGILLSSSKNGFREARKLAKSNNSSAMAQGCVSICTRAGLQKNHDFQVGKSKVFLRAEATVKLETAKGNLLKHAVRVIQKAWRNYYSKNRFGRQARKIQRLYRGYRIRKRTKPMFEKRKAAANFIHSSPNMRRWVASIRRRIRENPSLSKRSGQQKTIGGGGGHSIRELTRSKEEEDLQQLWWIAIPFVVLISVPTLAATSPALLFVVLLAVGGAALGSFLVLDAQKNGKFNFSTRNDDDDFYSASTKKKKIHPAKKPTIKSPPNSPRRAQAAAFLPSSPTNSSRSLTHHNSQVEIKVNGEALKRFAGLAAAKRKEAMDRARQRAEDMLLAGELTSKPVPLLRHEPPPTHKEATTNGTKSNGHVSSPQNSSTSKAIASSTSANAKKVVPPLPEKKPKHTSTSSSKPPPKQQEPQPVSLGKPRADTSRLDPDEQYNLNKAILSMFLEEQAPDQADMADDLLKEFAGKEESLFEKLTEEFPETNVLHSSNTTDTPVWDRFIKRKSSRRHKIGSRGSRGFFGTITSLEDEIRFVTESGSKTVKNGKSGTMKKKTESSHRSMFSKLTKG